MNRRVLSTAAAAAALVLAPTAAMAYTGDDDYEASVPGSVAQGVPFQVTLEGPNENAYFGLRIASARVPNSAIEIAGEAYDENDTDGNGVAVFDVTLHEEAVYEVTGTNAAGEVVLEHEIVVGDPADDDAAGDDDAAAGGGQLPDTGSSSTPLVIGAAALLAAGAGVLVFARRQQA
ncbi:LPXTG-motif cell wall-anchored protein [Georgenia soli]|uniref:LPXTG-motif cell wall-anchored protein n=1 Tax=Georgenia soli TaxID=638953 RepID=A0A2A9EJC5_9MICO|nr:LPXTG cell wall anchor domain-containing protein [Georgenia soli]PFG39008.1 LPXTG-motif cell wall-anchored protein [Georgenia soli]